MKNMQEAIVFIRLGSGLADAEIISHFSHLDTKFKDFLSKLELEDVRTKAAFHLVVQSAVGDRHLSHEEKIQVGEQLKELLKTADLVALTVLPGGTIVLVLATFLKLNKYIIPSVFLSPDHVPSKPA